MSGMVGFLVAVSGVSAVIYWMMTRVENRAAARRSGYDHSGSDSSYAGSTGGWSLSDWFGGDSSFSHGSGTSSDYSGGSDSGGGGGGDGGGGGGGDKRLRTAQV
jgi:hypothetical protein